MVTVAAVLMAMLNALHRFFIPALSPAMFNVATILCAVIFVPLSSRFGIEPIVAIAVGTLLGGLGQIALQWPAARREGFRYRPLLDLSDPWLREIGRLMVPGVAGLAAVQINLLINSWLATGLGTGAVSWLDYAFRLMYMPIGLFGISIATAALPGIAGYAASNNARRRSSGRFERTPHDVDAEYPGDRRTGRSCDADRCTDLRARPVYPGRHRGDCRGARVLRARPRRILGCEAHFAGVLCVAQQPGTGHRERRERRIQHSAEPDARQGAGPPRPRVGNSDGRTAQWRRASVDVARAPGRSRREARAHGDR